LDAGYLSRLLADLQKRGLIRREPSKADGRRHLLSLTARGRKTFGPLEERSSEQVAAMLAKLSRSEKKRLLGAMETIEELLGDRTEPKVPYVLRAHKPGDMGWVVHRHGALYAQEYGWDETFEALVAEIAARFIRNFDPARERCWIVEREGEIVGSVFLVRKSKKVAKLRMLLVEPSARGLGLGSRLVAECVRFARSAGYRKVTLWTQSVLHAARRIYEKESFRLVASKPNESFGHSLVAETWELDL
jgi:GNAT superfamily N-acetyltransferase